MASPVRLDPHVTGVVIGEPNRIKRAFADGTAGVQWGLFLGLADPVAAEICAGAGFDFVVIDTEHAPNDLRTVLVQLQAIAAYPVEPAVRVWHDDPATVKRVLDLGARTIVLPMIESAEQAQRAVAATRYPPDGVRGVSSARAAQWGRIEGYHAAAADQLCVVVQIETAQSLDHLEEICSVEGVDVAFIGPMDLATSLGHLAGGTHPDVVAVVESAIGRIAATGVVAGVLAGTPELARRYVAAGARFVAAGVDTAILASATSSLRRSLPPS